jgi:predicted flap endonuclease-1-like 5' DNA nuclease
MLAIQTFLLMAIAWILGCAIGCLLHGQFGGANAEDSSSTGKSTYAGSQPDAVLRTSTLQPKVLDRGTGSYRNTGRDRLLGRPIDHEAAKTPAAALSTGRDGDSGGQGVSAGSGGADLSSAPPAPPPAPATIETVTAQDVPKASTTPAAAASVGSALVLDPNDEKAIEADKAGERPPALPAPRGGAPDNLKMVKGIGPQNEARLNALGTYHFDQIASWNAEQCKWVGSYLAFAGRIERENWVDQAGQLAKGEATEFSGRVAAGKVASSTGTAEAPILNGKKPRTMKEPRKAGADKLTKIEGVGNAIEKRLFDLGIFHFSQIEKWTPENTAWIGRELGFPGRVEREDWVAKAKALSKTA